MVHNGFELSRPARSLILLFKIPHPEHSIANRPARGVGCSEWLCGADDLVMNHCKYPQSDVSRDGYDEGIICR